MIEPEVPARSFVADADFVEVYLARYAAMVRVAVLMLGEQSTAEEVVQEAFIAAYQRWDKIDTPSAYIRQSTVNRCRDVLRRRRVAEAFGAKRDERTSIEPPEHVDDLLRALPPRQRAAVVLRFYEDLSVDEIADLLHTRPGTVKSMLHRALARLREDIQP